MTAPNVARLWVIYRFYGRRRWLFFGRRRLKYLGHSGRFNRRAAEHASTQEWWPEVDPTAVRVEVLPPDVQTAAQAREIEGRYIAAEGPQYNQVGNLGRYDRAAAVRAGARRSSGGLWWGLYRAAAVSWLALTIRREIRATRDAVARLAVLAAVAAVAAVAVTRLL